MVYVDGDVARAVTSRGRHGGVDKSLQGLSATRIEDSKEAQTSTVNNVCIISNTCRFDSKENLRSLDVNCERIYDLALPSSKARIESVLV